VNRKITIWCLYISLALLSFTSESHENRIQNRDDKATVNTVTAIAGNAIHYLGNEALLVESTSTKILFDPFFHNNLGIYQLVPEDIKQHIYTGTPPFDQINAIFLSHAHRDHFDVKEMVTYLQKFPHVTFFASKQAIEQVKAFVKSNKITLEPSQLHAISLSFGDDVWQKTLDDIEIGAVRIPHAGWPSRADVENLVFSITLDSGITVMHMGDADPNDDHYLAYKNYWLGKQIDVNFPPYWFFFSAEGRDILTDIIGAKRNIGIHVPMKLPSMLSRGAYQYFHNPGEKFTLDNVR